MADTKVQLDVERWLVQNYLPEHFHARFAKKKVRLHWGGEFEFDAVSDDNKIAGCISTSGAHTASGKLAVGKYHKIKADAFYLNAAVGVARKFLLFTDDQMRTHFEKERDNGRFPQDIELICAPIPPELGARLRQSARAASSEVTPTK